ncbi:MAG: ribonuclease R [Candidatus Marinimicrobia bacterium]|nr:ribonuclease R [Candidatus Neomarinimicrobiota bacterium]
MKRKSLEEKIIKYLKNNRGNFIKQRSIFKAIGDSRVDYSIFKKVIKRLSEKGRIERGRKHTFRYPDMDEKTVTGTITLKSKGFGFVKTDSGNEIFIGSYDILNAFDGDKVLVHVYKKQKGKLPEGKVVKILERATKTFYGTLKRRGGKFYLLPEKPEHPTEILITNKIPGMKDGKLVEVKNLRWDDPNAYTTGEVVKIIGDFKSPYKDIEVVIKMFDLPREFPKALLKEVDELENPNITEELKYRKDLRDKEIFTIDPINARDFDDAVSIEINEKGNYLLGIHISDVSHFVKPGTLLDREALKRGLSVYFAETVIPMLPERLSGDLCSLKPGEERLTITIDMELDRKGNLLNYDIYQSVIESKRRFTYEEVQEIIDTGKGDFADTLKLMRDVSKLLYDKRRMTGSIDFDIPEPVFEMGREGIPLDIRPSIRLDSHRLIEEFMLLANKTVAEHISITRKSEKLPFIYRVHEKPSEEAINNLYDILARLGLSMKKPEQFNPSDLQEILEKVEKFPFKNLVEILALRSMAKAKYSTKPIGHFGLAFKYYTHFTSPIRRYPDLMVHRLLKYYEEKRGKEEIRLLRRRLRNIAKKSSENELKSLEAEREYIKIKQTRFLKNKIGDRFKGIISGIANYGFFVEISDFLVDGFVHVRTLYDDYYVYDGENHAIVGKKYGKKYRLGDIVEVIIKEVSIEDRRIDLEITH